MYPITINDKGGKLFRKYNEDTLRTIYSASVLGANFEVSVLIEGLIYMALLNYYALHDNAVDYFGFVTQKNRPALGEGIRKLESLKIFDKSLIEEMKKYKTARNSFIHDPFRMKTMIFNNYSISESLDQIFEQGIKLLKLLSPLVVPGRPTTKQWKKRYKATTKKNVINVNLSEVYRELAHRRAKEQRNRNT